MEPDSKIWELVLWVAGGSVGVAGTALALVKTLPRRPITLTNGQKALYDNLRRDVDKLMERDEKTREDIKKIEQNVAVISTLVRPK